MSSQEVKIKWVDWYDDHWYRITLEDSSVIWCASATTKLGVVAKPFLAKWRGDIGNREADLRVFEASQRGVRKHDAWQKLTTGGAVVFQPELKPIYSGEELSEISEKYEGRITILRTQEEMYSLVKLTKFLEVVKPQLMASEETVYSLEHKEAGTMDNLMLIAEGKYMVAGSKPLEIKGGIYVVDLKTGNAVDDTAFMQTACYRKCKMEMSGMDIEGTLILHTEAQMKNGIEGFKAILRTREQADQDYEDFRHASALWERKNKDAKPETFELPTLLTLKKEKEDEARQEGN